MTKPDGNDDVLHVLKGRLRRFAAKRDWEQFHTPKNLAMALIAEAGELVEHFQWLSDDESGDLSPGKLEEVRLELADILIYVVRLADKLDIDLAEATSKKIAINEEKYPADRVRGDARKYTEYRDKETGRNA